MNVRLVRTNEDVEKSQQPANFINEIKHIREYCRERYGVCGALKDAKDLVESVYRDQQVVVQQEDLLKQVRQSFGIYGYGCALEALRKVYGLRC